MKFILITRGGTMVTYEAANIEAVRDHLLSMPFVRSTKTDEKGNTFEYLTRSDAVDLVVTADPVRGAEVQQANGSAMEWDREKGGWVPAQNGKVKP